MATLFITCRWPDPLATFTYGTALRMRMFLRALHALGDPIDLLLFRPQDVPEDPSAPERIAGEMRARWALPVRSVTVAPRQPRRPQATGLFGRYVLPAAGIGRQSAYAEMAGPSQRAAVEAAIVASVPQRIFIHRLNAMVPLLAMPRPAVPVFFDLDDIEHRAFARSIKEPPHWRSKPLQRLQLPALVRAERQAAALAARTFVCSDADRVYLSERLRNNRIAVVPNALPVPAPAPPCPAPTVLFIGVYLYEPNRQAAERLAHRVWPWVRARCPGARLLLAGRHAELVHGHGAPPPGVQFLGFVADLDDLYAGVRIVACPIQSGAGTRVKIIEAALYGRPVVSTTLGAEGLQFDPARGEIVIADGDEAMAAEIVRLLGDPARAQAVGAAARSRALAAYSESAAIETALRNFRT